MRPTPTNLMTATPTALTGSRRRRGNRIRRRGAVLVYTMSAMVVFLGICSLAVDWGRVQVTKTELQSAADAAARAGSGSLPSSPAAAVAQAQWVAKQNKADGTAVDLGNSEDVQIGYWDTQAGTFTRLFGSDQYRANAVKTFGRRDASRNNAVSMSFARAFGIKNRDVSAMAIAMVVPPVDVNQPVLATANPFLAGMPAGSVASVNNPHKNPDHAGTTGSPLQSPSTVNIPLVDGQGLTFDSIDGTARHDPSLAYYEPDGQLNDIGHNINTPSSSAAYGTSYYNENGIADTRAPINALVGLFLSDEQPDKTAAPANLDFSSAASRDFDKLEPKLKQIFFIGDGLNSKGQQQKFIVPKGATRLVLATWDFYEWNNNLGTRIVKVERPQQVILVK